MKYLLTILLTIISMWGMTQIQPQPEFDFSLPEGYYPPDTTQVEVSHIYMELIILEFVQDAMDYGLDSNEVRSHIKKLDFITHEKLPGDNLGLTLTIYDIYSGTMRGAIAIDPALINNYNYYRLTLYHELGHWFGLSHKKGGIMQGYHGKLNMNKWDRWVRKFMRKVKKILKHKKTD